VDPHQYDFHLHVFLETGDERFPSSTKLMLDIGGLTRQLLLGERCEALMALLMMLMKLSPSRFSSAFLLRPQFRVEKGGYLRYK
jgi:hypothetical protein